MLLSTWKQLFSWRQRSREIILISTQVLGIFVLSITSSLAVSQTTQKKRVGLQSNNDFHYWLIWDNIFIINYVFRIKTMMLPKPILSIMLNICLFPDSQKYIYHGIKKKSSKHYISIGICIDKQLKWSIYATVFN